MSTEAHRNNGTGEPVTPQVSKGGFSGFLRGLTGVPSESHHPQQSTSRIVQPPPGLEDFAAGLKQGIEGHFATVRQQELDRQNAEALRISIEAEKQAQAEAKQRELAEQERVRREKAFAEASKILKDFRVEEKLDYIRQRYWEGKGEIIPAPLLGVSLDGDELQGGFELSYRFTNFKPVFDKWEHRVHDGRSMSRSRSKVISYNESTRLVIALINEQQGEKVFRIYSGRSSDESTMEGISFLTDNGFSFVYRGSYSVFEGKRIPVNAEDSDALLEAAFIEDVTVRRQGSYFPAQLEKQVRRNYTLEGPWTYDPPGEVG